MTAHSEVNSLCTRLLDLRQTQLIVDSLCDFTPNYETNHLTRVMLETLGPDQKASPTIKHGDRFWQDTSWKNDTTQPVVATNRDMAAALNIVMVEAAREALKKPVDTLVRIAHNQAFYQGDVDGFIANNLNLRPAAALYLAEPANVAAMRARFPEAGLTDARIEAALQHETRTLPSLEERQGLLPKWAHNPRPAAATHS